MTQCAQATRFIHPAKQTLRLWSILGVNADKSSHGEETRTPEIDGHDESMVWSGHYASLSSLGFAGYLKIEGQDDRSAKFPAAHSILGLST